MLSSIDVLRDIGPTHMFRNPAGRERYAQALADLQTLYESAEKFCGRLDAPEYLREAVDCVRRGSVDYA